MGPDRSFLQGQNPAGAGFQVLVRHDPARTGGYAYAFLPCCDAKRTERFARNPSVRILRNDAGCQAVEYGKICCAVVTGPENTASAGGRSRRRNRRSTSSVAAGPRSAAFRP